MPGKVECMLRWQQHNGKDALKKPLDSQKDSDSRTVLVRPLRAAILI